MHIILYAHECMYVCACVYFLLGRYLRTLYVFVCVFVNVC